MNYVVKTTCLNRTGEELYSSQKEFSIASLAIEFSNRQQAEALEDKDAYLQTNEDGYVVVVKNRNKGIRVKVEIFTFGLLMTELEDVSSELLTSTLELVEEKIAQERTKNRFIVKKNGALTVDEISELWTLENIAEDIGDEIANRGIES